MQGTCNFIITICKALSEKLVITIISLRSINKAKIHANKQSNKKNFQLPSPYFTQKNLINMEYNYSYSYEHQNVNAYSKTLHIELLRSNDRHLPATN